VSKVIVSNLMTLNGYAAGPGGDVMALPFDESFSPHNLALLESAGSLLLGATSFAGFRDYWPSVADDESQPEVERAISRRNSELPKFVVSDTLSADDTGAYRDTTTIIPRADAHERIDELRRTGSGDMLTFGSITLVNDLLAAGLVDELYVLVGGGVLADGVLAFSTPPSNELRLEEARQLPDSNTALLRYALA
jgi:dihydrofolate reductase